MKKLLLMLIGVLIALPILAADGDDFSFTYQGQTITYTIISETNKNVRTKTGTNQDRGNNVSGDLILPEKVTYKNVEYTLVSIGSFSFNRYITSVKIPNSVTSIGNSAFRFCESLTNVEIGNSVSIIGRWAFEGCSSLTSVVIPNSVTNQIMPDAFEGCTGLIKSACPNSISNPFRNEVSISYPADNCEFEDGIIYGKDKSAIWFVPLDYNGKFEIPNSVTSIGAGAFYSCGSITDVVIPNSVTEIGGWAFKGCTGLKKSAYPNTISNPFSNGISISYPADNCEFEDGIIYGKDKSAVWFVPLDYNGEFEIPNSVTEIGGSAFKNCSNLTSVEIPNSVTKIGSETFMGCSNLESVIIGKSVTKIGDYAFDGCTGLIKVAYPDRISNPFKPNKDTILIKYPANNSELEGGIIYGKDKSAIWYVPYNYKGNFNIPDSVKEIGESAFAGCSAITSVEVNWEYPMTIDVNTFTSDTYNNAVLNIPENTWGAYLNCEWGFFKNIYCNGNKIGKISDDTFVYRYNTGIGEAILIQNDGYKDLSTITIPDRMEADGRFYNVTGIGNNAFYGCTEITNLILPQNINSIYDNAFKDCSGLYSITLPDGLILIGKGALENCSRLQNIKIPNSVTSIGSSAFKNCSRLTSVVIPNKVTSIEGPAFEGCTGLKKSAYPNTISNPFSNGFSISYPADNCEFEEGIIYGKDKSAVWFVPLDYKGKFEMPSSANSIGDLAFDDFTGLTGSIEIPNSVTSIGVWAFNGCSNLKGVEIPNSVTEIGERTFRNCSSLTSVVIPNKVTSIGTYAFEGCSSLTSVVIPNKVASIGGSAFEGCSSLTSVVIPNSVTYLGGHAFEGCTGLIKSAYPNSISKPFNKGIIISYPTDNCEFEDGIIYGEDKSAIWFVPYNYKGEFEMPSSANSIGDHAFANCTGLTGSIEIPNSVTSIGASAFEGCSNLTSVKIGNAVTEIEGSVFKGCNAISELVIGFSMKQIGDKAFADCNEIEKVTCSGRIPPLADKNIFTDLVYRFASLYVPEEYVNNYKTTDPWSNFFDIVGQAGVSSIIDDQDSVVTVYSINGTLVKKGCSPEDLKLLDNGIYIINGRKVMISK